MSLQNIGSVIQELRKQMGVRQEDLANAVGVSTQAVSKWENGGAPDAELLPAIADYFKVSIDRLFGRNIGEYSDLGTEIVKYLCSFGEEEKLSEAYNLYWATQMGLANVRKEDVGSYKYSERKRGGDSRSHSGVFRKTGFSYMSLWDKLKFALIMPTPEDGWFNVIPQMAEYQKFFEAMSDIDVLDAIGFIYTRESDKPFTTGLLVKELNLTTEKAEKVAKCLCEYRILEEREVEFDDEMKAVYSWDHDMNENVIAMLVFSNEVMNKPNSWFYYSGKW